MCCFLPVWWLRLVLRGLDLPCWACFCEGGRPLLGVGCCLVGVSCVGWLRFTGGGWRCSTSLGVAGIGVAGRAGWGFVVAGVVWGSIWSFAPRRGGNFCGCGSVGSAVCVCGCGFLSFLIGGWYCWLYAATGVTVRVACFSCLGSATVSLGVGSPSSSYVPWVVSVPAIPGCHSWWRCLVVSHQAWLGCWVQFPVYSSRSVVSALCGRCFGCLCSCVGVGV